MALSPSKALEAARNIIAGPRSAEQERLNRISRALSPRWDELPTVQLPKDANDVQKALAWKARTNFLPLVLKTFTQVMKVDGYAASAGADNGKPWKYWQRNQLDARQTGVHRSALAYGASYVTVMPGDNGPTMRGVSARQMTAVYQDSTEDEWPMLALRVDGPMIRLYDEEQVYFFGAETVPRSGLGQVASTNVLTGSMEFIESRPHPLGVCPVVRFRDRMLLDGEEQFGIIEPIITIQQRIDETTYAMMVAQFYAAFKQRYVIGWVPKSEAEEMKASAADFWTFDDGPDDVKVGQFEETDLTRYIKSKESASQDMAAIAQVPAQNLGIGGISNISAETLTALETGKERESDEITTSLGESWEQSLRAAALLDGDTDSADDFSSQVRWKDATARSFGQTVDALGKISAMLHFPDQMLWKRIPGVTDQDIAEAERLVATGDPLTTLLESLDRQSTAAAANAVQSS